MPRLREKIEQVVSALSPVPGPGKIPIATSDGSLAPWVEPVVSKIGVVAYLVTFMPELGLVVFDTPLYLPELGVIVLES